MKEQLKKCEALIDLYMGYVREYKVEDLVKLFTEEGQIYSPLLGWVEPRFFFNRMREVSVNGVTTLEPRNTCVSVEGKLSIAKHFIYNWELGDGRKTSFEVVDIFEFAPDCRIEKEIIIYDSYQLRNDLGGNPLI